MPIMNNDLRVVKTKRAIENALLSLLEVMPFSKVRIINIAERAMVNRNTIYLHYESKEAIVMSIINRQFSENLIELSSEDLFSRLASRTNLKKIYTRMLRIINSNIDLYRIVLMDTNLKGYISVSLDHIKKEMYKMLKPTKKNLLGVEYIVNGSFGMISRWIIYATGELEEVADLLTSFTYSEFKHLSK